MPPLLNRKPDEVKFWNVRVETTTIGETIGHIYIYGIISKTSWWDDEITPRKFLDDIEDLGPVQRMIVHIFSDGGDVFAGTAIHAILKQQAVPVDVYIEGIAASIATIVALAGTNIYISRTGMVMIHNAMAGLFGFYNVLQLRRYERELVKISEPIIATYMAATGKTHEEIQAIMDGEDGSGTWYNAEEAIAIGLATGYIPQEVEEQLDAVACIGPDKYQWGQYTFDLSRFSNAPRLQTRRNTNMSMPTTTQTTPALGVPAPASNSPQAAAQGAAAPQAHAINCPSCQKTMKIDASIKNEIIDVTCPYCGESYQWDTVAGAAVEDPEETDPAAAPEPEEDSQNCNATDYRAGIQAERARMVALDGIAKAIPAAASIVEEAKNSGWSFEVTSGKVFDAMSKGEIQNTGSAAPGFMQQQQADFLVSGAASVGAASNATPANGAVPTEVQQAAQMIAAGYNRKA